MTKYKLLMPAVDSHLYITSTQQHIHNKTSVSMVTYNNKQYYNHNNKQYHNHNNKHYDSHQNLKLGIDLYISVKHYTLIKSIYCSTYLIQRLPPKAISLIRPDL